MAEVPDVSETLKKLRSARRALSARLEEVDAMISELESIERRILHLNQPDLFAKLDELPLNSSFARPLAPVELAARVEQLIRNAGRPMVRSEIAAALEASGAVLAGKDRNKNVGTILWRHRDRFVNLPKLGYWLADTELPGVYTPPAEQSAAEAVSPQQRPTQSE